MSEPQLVQPAEIQGNQISKFLSKISGQPASYARKSNYTLGKTLGAGTFGVVREARYIPTNMKVAMKIILKKTLKGNFEMVYDELRLLQNLRHPNIVEFKDWFESKDKFFIATQLATGGELFDRIIQKGRFTEKDAAVCIKQILEALKYLHANDIVHRDIKPENVLMLKPEDEDPTGRIVLADFGIAKKLRSKDELITVAAGSFGYAAPEVLLSLAHGKPCDIWSTGVITYTILCGYSPFRSENVNDFLMEVKNDNGVVFHNKYWSNVSSDAKYFILKMLRVDPSKRSTAEELLEDKWIQDNNNDVDLLPGIREGFNARNKFIQAIEVIRLKNRIKKLNEIAAEGQGVESQNYFDDDFSFVSSSDDQAAKQKKSDMTLKALQLLVLTAKKNKERVESFNDESKD